MLPHGGRLASRAPSAARRGQGVEQTTRTTHYADRGFMLDYPIDTMAHLLEQDRNPNTRFKVAEIILEFISETIDGFL
jgi:hypothetical protein